MYKCRLKRITGVLVSGILILTEVLSFTGCNGKDKGGVQKVSKDSAWYNSTTTEIKNRYEDKKLDYINYEIVCAYKDGVVLWAEGDTDKGNDPVNNFDYYTLTGELISSVDVSKVMFSRYIDKVTVNDDGITLRIHDSVVAKDSKETGSYMVTIDPETGTVGELKEVEKIPVDTYDPNDPDPVQYLGTWNIGDYTVSQFEKSGIISFTIKKDGKSKSVELTGDPHFSNLYRIDNYVQVSEMEILLISSSNNVGLISLNLETGEVRNKDEEYSWLKKITQTRSLYSFDGKTYFKDVYGIKVINFASKELEEVLSFNDCNVNRSSLKSMDLICVKDNKFVFANVYEDRGEFDYSFGPSEKVTEIPTVIVLEKTEKNPNAGKIILSTGTFGIADLDYSVCEAVRVFNETNSKYFVRLDNKLNIADYIDYSDAKTSDEINTIYYNGAVALSNQMATDIMSGNGPDIILYAGNYRQIQSEEYLLDLTGYINGNNGINEADYFSNVISAAKTGDKLFYMPVSFAVLGIATDKANVRDGQTGFTFDEYNKFVDEVCNGANPIEGSRLEVISTLYSYMGDTCIDGKNADFDNESFRALCDYVKNNVNDKSFSMCTDAKDTWFVSFDAFLRENGFKSKNMTLLGYPSTDGRGPVISVQMSVGISAGAPSVVADGAWEFIRTYLSDEVQSIIATRDFNPVNMAAYESVARTCLDSMNKANPLITPMDDSVISSYKDVLLSASVTDNNDPAIIIVIREEIPPYFIDQKTLDEILPIINNRVKTILSERS